MYRKTITPRYLNKLLKKFIRLKASIHLDKIPSYRKHNIHRKLGLIKKRLQHHKFQFGLSVSLLLFTHSTKSLGQNIFNTSTDLNPNSGYNIQGVYYYGRMGRSMDGIGDFNGDGYNDFVMSGLVGDPDIIQTANQLSYFIILGSPEKRDQNLQQNELPDDMLFEIKSHISRFYEVYGIGDINGDHKDDIMVRTGRSTYNVIYGKSVDENDQPLELASFTPEDGFVVESNTEISAAGQAGLYNKDELNDIVFATPKHAYILMGNNYFSDTLHLNELNLGVEATRINVSWGTYEWIDGVNTIGDINHDGFDDVGINKFTGSWSSADTLYVIYGKEHISESIAYSDVKDENGFKITAFTDGYGSKAPSTSSVFESIGDINGDGFNDLAIGRSYYYEYNEHAHIIFGNDSSFNNLLFLDSLDGSDGFDLGTFEGGYYSMFIGGKGDVDGDGIDDIAVSIGNDETYILFGEDKTYTDQINFDDLKSHQKLKIDTEGRHRDDDHDWIELLDVNNDGIDDIIIAKTGIAFQKDDVESGEVNIIYGSPELRPLESQKEKVELSEKIADSGDFNGDGHEDLLLFNRNTAYIIFGDGTSKPSTEISEVDNKLTIKNDIRFSILKAVDLNNDGIDDIIAKDYLTLEVMWGKQNFDTDTINWGEFSEEDGMKITSESAYHLGNTIMPMDDFNGDGINDVAIFDYYREYDSKHSSYILFGSDEAFPQEIAIDHLEAGDGLEFTASGNYWSAKLMTGDFNGDGISDLASGLYPENTLEVVYGKKEGFSEQKMHWNNLFDGVNGFKIDNTAEKGFSMTDFTLSGDINHDGKSDIIMVGGLDWYGERDQKTQVIVYYGTDSTDALVKTDSINGQNGFIIPIDNENINVSSGVDFNGDGVDDFFIGATGNGHQQGSYVIYGDCELPESRSISLSELVVGNRGEYFQSKYNFGDVLFDVNADSLIDLQYNNASFLISSASELHDCLESQEEEHQESNDEEDDNTTTEEDNSEEENNNDGQNEEDNDKEEDNNDEEITDPDDDPISASSLDHQNIIFYPNPTTNRLYFSGIDRKDTIRIFDGVGKLITVQSGESPFIDTSNWRKGIYLVAVKNKRYRIVKQ